MKNTGIFDLIWFKFWFQKNLRKKIVFESLESLDPELDPDPDWAKMLDQDPYWINPDPQPWKKSLKPNKTKYISFINKCLVVSFLKIKNTGGGGVVGPKFKPYTGIHYDV
jgi:hypothetical protein